MSSAKAQQIPFIFILSWERPIYLWACLDSFYRATMSPCHFVIADNNSQDPLVREVIRGFERRGMFHAVHICEENHPRRFEKLIEQYWDQIGDKFVFIEGDTAVVASGACWLKTMRDHMDADASIGAIGSRVYQEDFVSWKVARKLCLDMKDSDLRFLIKSNAPMRHYQHTIEPLIAPHNPPLRLLMMRKAAYAVTGFGLDTRIHRKLIESGWKSVISTQVVHRHLSLLNIFDYPNYDRHHRDRFFDYSNKPKTEES